MMIVSLLIHVAAIILLPSVGILSPAPTYIEIEAIFMEPEESHEEQAADVEDLSQEPPVYSEEPLHPLNVLDSVDPDMIEQRKTVPDEWELFAPEETFRLTKSLEPAIVTSRTKTFSPRPDANSVNLEVSALRDASRQAPEISNPQSDDISDDIVTEAVQPYERETEFSESMVPHEVMPDFALLLQPQELIERPHNVEFSAPSTLTHNNTHRISPPTSEPVLRGHLEPEQPHLSMSERKEPPETVLEDIETPIEEPKLLAMAEVRPLNTKESEPTFMKSDSLTLPENQRHEVSPIPKTRTREPHRPQFPARVIQKPLTEEQVKSDYPQVKLPDIKERPEKTHDDIVMTAEEIESSDNTEEPSDMPEESQVRLRYPESAIPVSQALEPTYSADNVSTQKRIIISAPEQPASPSFSHVRTAKLLVPRKSNPEKPVPSFQNFSSFSVAKLAAKNAAVTPVTVAQTEEDKEVKMARINVISREGTSEQGEQRGSAIISRERDKRLPKIHQGVVVTVTSPSVLEKQTLPHINETFFTKQISEMPVQEDVLQATQRRSSVKQPSNQRVSETRLPLKPRSLTLQAERSSFDERKNTVRPAPVQRLPGIGGELASGQLQPKLRAFGLFVKEENRSDFEEQKEVLQRDDTVKQITKDGQDEVNSFVIEGPASRRRVIYKPVKLPQLSIDMEVNIRLKFWVLPDGTVGEVIPLQRGDVRLERAAIKYLKSWRFTPVAPNSQKVWGIVPISYKLR